VRESGNELPVSWELVDLAELAAPEPRAITDGPFGSNLKTSHYTDSGPRVIRLENVGDGFFIDHETHISGEHFENLRRHEARSGDVVVATLGHDLPRACLIPAWLGKAIVKADCVRIRPDPSLVGASYLASALNSHEIRRQADSFVHGVGRPRLNLKSLRRLGVPLAPLAEQRRIVAALETHFSRLEAAVAALERARANLRRYRASVLKAACEGRLVPTEDEVARREGRDYEPAERLLERILVERRRRWEEAERKKLISKGKEPKGDGWKKRYKEPAPPRTADLPPLPRGWCWATLDLVAELQGGLTKGKKRRSADELCEVPYLRVANVQRGYLDLEEVRSIEATVDEVEKLRLLAGDVLFTEGGDRDKLGRGWIWSDEIADCIHQNHIFRARLYLRELSSKYVSWFGNTSGRDYFFRQGKQTTNLASINLTKLRELPIALPPPAEQLRIVEAVEDHLSIADSALASIDANLRRAERLRQSILKRAFEGKLVPQDPNDEPASVLLARIRAEREAAEDGKTKRGKTKRGNDKRRQREPSAE